MFSNTSPIFEKGRILKKEMLENLRDFPRNFFDYSYKDFSDGIMCGVEIDVDDKNICISQGVLKHGNTIYMLDKRHELPYCVTNTDEIIKIKFFDKSSNEDYIFYNTKIYSDKNTNLNIDELEIGRYKLREGATLRVDYASFDDFMTEFNTIGLVNSKYAGINESTLHPRILKYFANSMLKKTCQNPYDVSFAFLCLNNTRIERKVIIEYIKSKTQRELDNQTSNVDIFQNLATILRIHLEDYQPIGGTKLRSARPIK